MTRNPYAHPVDYGPDYMPEQRTSVMAILSLVFSLICCIPGSGVIGLILGIAAVIAISGSNGRLAGRGAAVAGIIIGAFTTVLWLAFAFGATQVVSGLSLYGDALDDLQAGRTGEARQVFAPSLDSAVTDEQLAEYGQRLASEWGQYQGPPGGLFDWAGAYFEIVEQFEQSEAAAGAAYTDLLPVPTPMSKGTMLVWVAPQGTIRGTSLPAVQNLGFVDQSGTIVWLVDPAAMGGAPGGAAPSGSPPPRPPTAPEPPTEGEPAEAPGGE